MSHIDVLILMGSDSDALDEGVFDPVEDALVVLRLVGDARCGVELLVQRLLLLSQDAWDDDIEIDATQKMNIINPAGIRKPRQGRKSIARGVSPWNAE